MAWNTKRQQEQVRIRTALGRVTGLPYWAQQIENVLKERGLVNTHAAVSFAEVLKDLTSACKEIEYLIRAQMEQLGKETRNAKNAKRRELAASRRLSTGSAKAVAGTGKKRKE
jgi:hypothetical protein